MSYDLKPVRAAVEGDRVTWLCPCGSALGLRFSRGKDGTFGYKLGEHAYPVTGGAGVCCPACGRRFVLPCHATETGEPAVVEVLGRG